MKKCWKLSPTERPRFNVLATILDKTLQSVAGYTELSMTLVEPTVTGEDDYEVMQPQDEGTNSEFKHSKDCLQRYSELSLSHVLSLSDKDDIGLDPNPCYGTGTSDNEGLNIHTDLNTAYGMRTVQ